jgi:hypothetical protein
MQPSSKPIFYRQYWPFAIIFILAPFGLLIGLLILSTGDIYKNNHGTYAAISQKEKITLMAVAIILQLLAVGKALHG